jgi:hypothetical protein
VRSSSSNKPREEGISWRGMQIPARWQNCRECGKYFPEDKMEKVVVKDKQGKDRVQYLCADCAKKGK